MPTGGPSGALKPYLSGYYLDVFVCFIQIDNKTVFVFVFILKRNKIKIDLTIFKI